MSLDVGLLAKGLEADQRADRIDAWRKWGRGKIRRVRTPEGARFYGAPIGTPIVADPKTGKLKAVRDLPAPGTYTFRDVPTQDGPTTVAITTYARGGGQMRWESPKRKFTHPYPEGEDEALVRMWRQLSEAASPEAEVVQPTPRTLLDTPITTVHKFTYDEPLWHVSLTGKPPGSNGWIHMGDKDAAKSRLRQTQGVFDDFAGEEKYEKVLRHVLLHDEQFEPQWFRPQILTQPLNGPGSLVSDEFANLVTSGRTKRVSPAEAREYGWDGNPLDVGHDEFSGEEFVAVQMGLDEWAARVEQFVSHAERTAQAWQDTDIARAQRRVWEQIQANGFRVDPLYYENRGEHTQAPSVVAAASDVAWDLYPTEDPLTFSKIRRVRTPEGAKFYNAPIGTPIVADKATGKLRALTTAKLPQAPLLKDWKPGDPTDRIKAQITDVVRGVLDEAGLPEGTLTVSVKPASTLSKLTVAVRYSRPDDYKKASVALHRQIYPSERKVHNWQFSVAKDLQGHGIGAKMTAALEDLWRSEGIETVTVGANADVGGYAWARLGFEFKDPAQAAEFVSDAQKQITKYAPIWAKKVSPEYVEDVKAQVQALQERLDAGDTILPAEIAMLGYREGLDDPPFYWLGKRVLLGTSWDGVKDLGRPKVQMVKTKRTKQTSEPLPDAFWDAFDADAEDFQMPEQAKAEPEQEEGWGPHRPAGPDYGSPLWAVDAGIYPSDIYTDFRAVDYYGSGDPDGYRRDSSMVDRIRRMQGRPTREVKIYRAIPKDAKSQWREGDWVTMERSYAVEHGRSALNGDYKIISKTVPAYTLWTEGNSLQEWGYHPETPEPKIAYKDDFARWFARARKENPGLSRQDAWEQWKAEQITTDPEQGTILAQRTSKIRTDRKIPVSDPLTVQDIQRLAALEDEDPQRYFDLLDEDVQDRLWEAAQKSPVGRASDPVWRDWWYHRFEAEDLPPKPPRGRWTVQEGEYPDTETRLRNESGDTILSEVPLTERQQQLLVQDFDFLLSKVPPSTFENVKHGHLGLVIPAQDGTFGADKVEGVDWNTFGAINGYVIDKIPVINLNPELLNRIEPTSGPYSGPHGYGFEITNSLRGVMAHEMGHVIDFANGHTASQSQQDWQQVIDTAYGVILNEHTRKDPQETYAELFGMWVMGFKDYDTGLLDKYAQQFGWEQPDDAVLTLSREDEVRSKVRSVQKVKDTLTDIDVGMRTGVRARIEKAVGDYFAYARQVGINNPMLSPAEVFARADVQALWAQEAASLHSWLANRISEGFYKGADLGRSGDAHGVLDEGYLDAVNQDLTNYLATLDSQVRSAVWNAYNQIDWVPSYAQGGTSTNVPHDTAVKRWDTASDSQSAVVTDISRRAHAGISAATHRGYTEGQLSTITDTSMLKMWVANFAQPPERGPCLTCIALHGMTIPVTEQFPAEVTYAAKPLGVYRDLLGPPRHPNCRCKLVFFAAGQEHEPVSKKMNEYAMDVVTSTMATTGFTAKQVRALPEPLFERLWRFLMRGGWWKRLWKRLRSG